MFKQKVKRKEETPNYSYFFSVFFVGSKRKALKNDGVWASCALLPMFFREV